MQTNKFNLNLSKTSYINFRPINALVHYKLDLEVGQHKTAAGNNKFLGVWFNEHL